jgi:tetratricopeptide (TPR) repeat protein
MRISAKRNSEPPSEQGAFRSTSASAINKLSLAISLAALAVSGVLFWSSATRPPVPAPPPSTTATSRAAAPSESDVPQPIRKSSVKFTDSALKLTAEELDAEAQQLADEMLARYPDLPEALHVAALLHAQQRRSEKAMELWSRCVALSPASEQYRANLATVALQRGDTAAALAVLEPAVRNGSQSPDVLHHYVVALTSDGRCAEAIETGRRAVKLFPESAVHWLILGQAQLKEGESEAAEASLRKALALGGETADLCFALGNACGRNDKPEEAAEFRQRFVDLQASSPLPVRDRFATLTVNDSRRTAVGVLIEGASVHSWQRDSLEAERLLLRALALDPGNIAALQTLAKLYEQGQQVPELLAVYERLARIDAGNPTTYLKIAQLAGKLQDSAQVESALKTAISVDPQFAPAFTELARWYLQQGRFDLARWYAQEAVRRNGTADGYALLASTCEAMGDQSTAKAALAEAKRIAQANSGRAMGSSPSVGSATGGKPADDDEKPKPSGD